MSLPVCETRLHAALAANVKRFRAVRRLSQAGLADEATISTSYVGLMETGRKFPSPDVMERLAEALGVKAYQLIMDEEDRAELEARRRVEGYSRRIAEMIVADLPELIAGKDEEGGTEEP